MSAIHNNLILLSLFIFTCTACSGNDAELIRQDSSFSIVTAQPTPADTHIVEFLQMQKQSWKAPSISATVAVHGEIVFAGAVGLAHVQDAIPATHETVYRIASTSKAVTAVAVLQLLDQGLIHLDDDIRKYVPEYPEKPWPITIQQVLEHSSGIRHYNDGETSRKQNHYESVADALNEFKDDDLRFEPGTEYGYSTFAYTLLQGVIESASGMSFRQYLRANVFQPAGMNNSDIEVKGEQYPLRAAGYRGDGDVVSQVGYDDVSFKYAGGGMISSTRDLAKFCIALGRGDLLSDSLREFMFTETKIKPGSGIAWGSRIDEHTGTRRVWHPGRSNGFESYLLYYPQEDVAVSILTNQHYTNPWVQVGGVAQLLANIYLPGNQAERATFPTTPIADALMSALSEGGSEAAVALGMQYQSSMAWRDWDFESELNVMGYQLMQGDRLDDAIEVFKLNVLMHPESWNVFDSMGEAYANRGDKQLAIESYETAVRLNPDHTNGIEKLRDLRK